MATESAVVPRLLTIKEVAKATGMARWRWHQLLAKGDGPPALRVGRTYRISETALARWIEEQGQNGGGR
jgi:excisionase family DNA binding protein